MGSFTSWKDFRRECAARGLGPAAVDDLRRRLKTYRDGGCTRSDLISFFQLSFRWARLYIPPEPRSVKPGWKRPEPTIIYPSDMLKRAFCDPQKAEIMLIFGKRESGKSTVVYSLAEEWLITMDNSPLFDAFGPAQVHFYGDKNGYVPARLGFYRPPPWFRLSRDVKGYPVWQAFDEIPAEMRSHGGVTKSVDDFIGDLFQTRHQNLWISFNVIDAVSLQKRIRETDAIHVDKKSTERHLHERLDIIASKDEHSALRPMYRELVPRQTKLHPALVRVDASERVAEEGTWVTFYQVDLPSWHEERDRLRNLDPDEALRTTAPWPREAVVMRLRQLLEPVLKRARKADDEDLNIAWQSTIGHNPSSPGAYKALVEHTLGHLGFTAEAIAEVTELVPNRAAARRVRGRVAWYGREAALLSAEHAVEKLDAELPPTNRIPFMPVGYARWVAKRHDAGDAPL